MNTNQEGEMIREDLVIEETIEEVLVATEVAHIEALEETETAQGEALETIAQDEVLVVTETDHIEALVGKEEIIILMKEIILGGEIMKLEIIKNNKSELEFIVEGERHTIPNLLREKLSQNSEVEFVAYRLDHPLDQKAVFVLKTKGSAKKVLEDTIKELQKDIDEFKKGFEKLK